MSKLDDLMKSLGIMDVQSLSYDIEQLRSNHDNYLDTIVDYCNTNNIDVTTIKPLLSPQIIAKLTKEMQDIHLITPNTTSTLF